MWDTLIAGAGPAGLVAATLLARAGRQVLLLDPQDTGRHKVGECVPGAIARLLRKLDLPMLHGADSPHRSIGGIVTHWADTLNWEDHFTMPEGAGWRLDRAAFERDLADAATAAGVLRVKARVRRVIRRQGGWQLETESGNELAAGFLIDATGRPAALARHLGASRIHGPPLVAVWGVGRPVPGTVSSRTLIESTADGWWYGAYLPDGRPIAIHHTTPAIANELRHDPRLWQQRLRDTGGLSRQIDASAFQGSTLTAHDARSGHLDVFCGPGWAACGDAALSFDPLSSQGIFHALASGDMAATAILDGTGDRELAAYQSAHHQVRLLYARRRELLYQSAAVHFKTPFWNSQIAQPVGLSH